MSMRQTGALLLLSALWGGSFLFMRIASPVLGPVLLIALRVSLAGLALLVHAAVTEGLPPLRTHWRPFLIIGALNSALPFLLIATASLSLPASLLATLNATTPLFGALVAARWGLEGLTGRTVAGILLGLVGVMTLVGIGPLAPTPAVLYSTAASLLAALSYGFAATYTKRAATGVSSQALSLYSQLGASLLLLPLVPFTWPHKLPTLPVVLSVLALALLCTALGYRLYFYLIQTAGPTRATLVTYLSPAFGMLWGALILGEPLGTGSFLGFGLILGSALLVSRKQR